MPESDHAHEDPSLRGSHEDEFYEDEPDVLIRYGWNRRHLIERDRLVMRVIEGFLEHHAWSMKGEERLNRLLYGTDPKHDFEKLMSENAYKWLLRLVETVQRRAGVPKPLRAHPLDFAEAYRISWKRKTLRANTNARNKNELAVKALIRIMRTKRKEEHRAYLKRILSCADPCEPDLLNLFSDEERREIGTRLHGYGKSNSSIDLSGIWRIVAEARYRILISHEPELVALREWVHKK